jgi:site-specific DNA-methyltransferase (adenine-specific)
MAKIELYNEDCMVAMSRMKDKEFDLAICDPPYGDECDIKTGGGSHTKSIVKFHQSYSEYGKTWNTVPGSEYFTELFRVSNNQVIWGGNYFALPSCRGFAVWDKIRYVKNFSQVEFAWTSFDKPALIFSFCGNGGFILSEQDSKIHPTQKPVRLYEWLLKNYANPGDKILDTHGGSCSLAIACDIMGFDCTIYEIDEDYYKAAVDRFNRHKQQLTLAL